MSLRHGGTIQVGEICQIGGKVPQNICERNNMSPQDGAILGADKNGFKTILVVYGG